MISSVKIDRVHAGGTYHRIFATSQIWNANLGGRSGADTKCQAAADAGGLDGTFSALISTSGSHARDALSITGPVPNLQDELLATSFQDFWDDSITNAVSYDEFGNVAGSNMVWTGTASDSYFSTDRSDLSANCSSFTDSLGTKAATRGSRTQSGQDWLDGSSPATDGCIQESWLYCIEQ